MFTETMSDPITPQLQEEVLEKLRELAATRNFTKTPEEIEKVLMEKSRGVKKVYCELFSRVLNSAPPTGANNPTSSHVVSVAPNVDHMTNTGQPTPGHLMPGPRPGLILQPHGISQSGQLVHVLPTSTTINMGPQPTGLGINRPPRLYTVAPQTGSLHMQQTIYQTQSGAQQRPDGQPAIQPIQPNQPGAVLSTPNRIVLIQSGGPSGSLRRLVTLPVSLPTPRSTLSSAVISHPQQQQQQEQHQVLITTSVITRVRMPEERFRLVPRRVTDGGSRSGSSSGPPGTKQPAQQYSAEDMNKILNGLTQLATRFLPAVRNAIQVVSELPDSAVYVRKYVKLRDILEHPQSNLHLIRLAQLPLIEQLLNKISRNPLQLFQEQQQQQQGKSAGSAHNSQQRSNQARATAAAAAAAAAAAKTMGTVSSGDAIRTGSLFTGQLKAVQLTNLFPVHT
ncbi:hypothetical protein FGIG_02365 [Fasciola gigantica]|uniref:Uncharacterized protein n=1 Tax=Fasciola gigantica TaxID=46835 RepID=A0A504Y7D6_FASGI|nr:hypothetical protein FGIG_02365 [Fasciola gigantica]